MSGALLSWANVQGLLYVLGTVYFILGLKWMGQPARARRGNALSALGMLLVVVVALLSAGLGYRWIFLGLGLGTVIGLFAAMRVSMIGMPGMVALFNGSGGLASMLLGVCDYAIAGHPHHYAGFSAFVAFLTILIGGVCATGSLVAWGKLSGVMSSKPWVYRGQHWLNGCLVVGLLILGVLFTQHPGGLTFESHLQGAALVHALLADPVFLGVLVGALLLGILLVMPIGGADMPVAISLLNSYSGLAACAAGYVIQNDILVVTGALVGMSGMVLTQVMCKAMNRSLSHILFSGFGRVNTAAAGAADQKEVKVLGSEDAYYVLEAANRVVIVPGYGMAVAQAQHAVSTLVDVLVDNGAEVKFAIHPVAGRMPGHMNVLLAEANIPYEQLVEMADINPTLGDVDVCLVIGANDVVNLAARDDPDSDISGMPIIEVDKAGTVFVLKRSMAAGFSGVENPLLFADNTRLLLGDAKQTLEALIEAFKS